MITLNFTINREPIRFVIEDKKIIYFDRKWDKGIQFIPKNNELIKYLLLNQRKFQIAQQIISWVNDANSGKNLEEYQSCQDDAALAEIVKRDAKKKGLVEIK